MLQKKALRPITSQKKVVQIMNLNQNEIDELIIDTLSDVNPCYEDQIERQLEQMGAYNPA